MNPPTVTFYRPVGPEELQLIADSGWRRFPPRLRDQPIFYPVCNEGYARQIARDWNVPASGAGHVLRFAVGESYGSSFPKQIVGGSEHGELWVLAEDLEELNDHIIGGIELVASYGREG